MRLTSIEYVEYEGEDREWRLSGLSLQRWNLIVGKNASGKSRTLNVIAWLSRLLCGRQFSDVLSGDLDAGFLDGDVQTTYAVRIRNGAVETERLIVGGATKLERGEGGRGAIEYMQLGRQEFQTPTDKLAAEVRQDALQHPFLQPLLDWAASVRRFEFGTPLGKEVFGRSSANFDASDAELDDDGPPNVVSVFQAAMRGPGAAEFKLRLLADLGEVGYPAEDVDVGPPISFETRPASKQRLLLRVRERGLRIPTDQDAMSQGMFRVLAILTLTNYLALTGEAGCIIVDDLGEGLDFDRSCRLIDVLRKKAETSDVQFIASTNDRFVMNKVPLEEWCVLQREGSHVRVLNAANSKEKFDDFRFTGLSNFSFLEYGFANSPTGEGTAPHD